MADDTVDTGNNSISVDTYASLALLAGNKVTLQPGFRAWTGTCAVNEELGPAG